ncbi:MAG: hypothetical protein HOV94_01525 [Saccharothrix sp.]|nr:hypothetical protein [Saccharothrix sp.]
MHSTSSRRRGALFAAIVLALMASILTTLPGAQAVTAPHAGVQMQDNPSDTGAEPGAGNIWHSPSIVVCPAGIMCSTDVPVTPTVTYDVRVTANNTDQVGHTGTMRVYHTKAGGDVSWPGGWVEFDSAAITLTPGSHTLVFQWTVPNEWRHYCLLARWDDDPADPMTIAEGLSTETNTRNNNNIVWHNVETSVNPSNVDVKHTWMIGNPLRADARLGLAIAPEGEPFVGPGRIVVDLGPTLFERWRAGGGQLTGLRQIGTTQFQVVDSKLARFTGLLLKAGERLPIGIVFNGTPEANGKPVNVFQTDAQGVDRGGVQYRLTFR